MCPRLIFPVLDRDEPSVVSTQSNGAAGRKNAYVSSPMSSSVSLRTSSAYSSSGMAATRWVLCAGVSDGEVVTMQEMKSGRQPHDHPSRPAVLGNMIGSRSLFCGR